MKKAIVMHDLEAFDGTKIKEGETVDVYFGLGYEPSLGEVREVIAGRRHIRQVNVKDLKFL